MAIMTNDLADLLNASYEDVQHDMIGDIATELRRYVGAEWLMRNAKIRYTGGDKYEFHLITDGDGNFRHVGYWDVDDINQVDATKKGTIEWRYAKSGCQVDTKQIDVNDPAHRIYNFQRKVEYAMWIDVISGFEADWWFGPSSSSDTTIPHGLLGYWLSYHATTGFNGGNHASFSGGPGGIDCDTYANHKNYTAQYTAMSATDALRKMRVAYIETGWMGIPRKPIKGFGPTSHDFLLATTTDNVVEFADIAENKARGKEVVTDVGYYDEYTPAFRKTPLTAVPYLDSNHATSDPIIMVDMNDMMVISPSKNKWEQRTPYEKAPMQNSVRRMQLEWSYNLVMRVRRRHALIAKSDPMSD